MSAKIRINFDIILAGCNHKSSSMHFVVFLKKYWANWFSLEVHITGCLVTSGYPNIKENLFTWNWCTFKSNIQQKKTRNDTNFGSFRTYSQACFNSYLPTYRKISKTTGFKPAFLVGTKIQAVYVGCRHLQNSGLSIFQYFFFT